MTYLAQRPFSYNMESPKLLKEFDTDSQVRKWKHTYAISPVPTSTNNPLIYIVDADGSPPDVLYREIYHSGLIAETVKRLSTGLPYFHFECRFYKTRLPSPSWAIIHKRVAKSFKVGLCTEAYYSAAYRDETDSFKDLNTGLLAPFNFGEPFAPIADPFKTIGAISPRLFVGRQRIFYMTTPIGLINRKERIISVGHECILQEVTDALKGHTCQINTL